MRSRLLLAVVVVVVVWAAVGCGGSGENPFAGEPVVPAGYTTYRDHGIAFVYPEGWTMESTVAASEATQLKFRPPDAGTGAVAGIDVTISTELASFEASLENGRAVRSDLTNADLEEPQSVVVPGAMRAQLTVFRFAGEDQPRADARWLNVQVEEHTSVSLSTRVPMEARQTLDVDAVVESFRLTGEPVTGASGSPTP